MVQQHRLLSNKNTSNFLSKFPTPYSTRLYYRPRPNPMNTKERYEAFVTKNEPLVRKLQEVANILVFLLPGNTVDGELAQEAGLAAINLFVIYHNLLFEAKKKCALASQTGRKGGLAAAQVAVRASRVSMLPNTTAPPTSP